MAALVQYKNSIGFASNALDEKTNVVTLYIPRSDRDRVELYETISKAKSDDGFFLQFLQNAGEGDWLDEFLLKCRQIAEANPTRRYALAVVDNVSAILNGKVSSFNVVVRRTQNWKQMGEHPISRKHLAGFILDPIGEGEIKGHLVDGEETALDLGKVRFQYFSDYENEIHNAGAHLLVLDLISGLCFQRVKIDKGFFKALRITQPMVAPVGKSLGGRVRCTNIRPRLIREESIVESVRCVLHFELFHHGLPEINLVGVDLSEKSQREKINVTRLEILSRNWLELDTGESAKLEMNLKDTMGRWIQVNMSGDAPASIKPTFRFFVTPKLKAQKSSAELSVVADAKLETVLVPQGVFPIENVKSSPEVRRLKLGPSNAEFVEIPSIFKAGTGFAIKFDPFQEQGGFLQRAAEKFLQEDELKKHDEYITDWVPTVWPSYVSLDSSGQVSAFHTGPTRQGSDWIYAVQPDSMILYGGDPNRERLLGENKRRKDYRKDDMGWVDEPLPFTFFHGLDLPDSNDEKELRRSDIETYLAHHRAQKFRTYQGSRLTELVRKSQIGKRPGSTPQTFIIDRYHQAINTGISSEENWPSWDITLAKTEQEGSSLKLSILVTEPHLQALFARNEFTMVLPGPKAWVDGAENEHAVRFSAKFQVGEWAFDVGFGMQEVGLSLDRDDSAELNTVVVLKYTKGSLRNMLKSPASWGNHSILKPEWVKSTTLVAAKWLKGIDKRKGEQPEAYRKVTTILDDTDWTGVLLINPVVDLGHLPSSLQAITSGMKLELFRANHFGFTLNRLSYDNPKAPEIKSSSLFGLIDYFDDEPLGDSETDFDFKVESLLALFENSEVQRFQSMLRVRLPSFFDEPISKVEGGAISESNQDNKESPRVFKVRGVYESRRNEAGKEIGRYSFIHEQDINLVSSQWIFESAKITRVELRTDRTEEEKPPPAKEEKKVESALVLDCEVAFKQLGGDSAGKSIDLLSFDKLSIAGLRLGFVTKLIKDVQNAWSQVRDTLPSVFEFDAIRVESDPARRRKNGFLKNFPVKYKSFVALGNNKTLRSLDYMELLGDKAKFGMEFDVDFGSLAKLIGFDTDLKGVLIVAWVPGGSTGSPSVALGLKFPEQGGRALDLDLGFLGIKSDYFATFNIGIADDTKGNTREQFVLVANNLRVRIISQELPSDDKTQFGLVLAPAFGDQALTRPMGWMTSLKVDQLLFIEDFFLALGQHFKLKNLKPNPKDIVNDVKELQSFSVKGLTGTALSKASSDYQTRFKKTFEYSPEHEWFAALAGSAVGGAGTAYALYNPPTMFGGALELKGLFEISILYKQLTEQVGLYTGSLLLDDNLRSINVGAVRLQIPRVTVELDTEGGFGLNIGLNVSKPDDFSDAAAAEVGIFKGDAGLYYSKLNGAAFKRMPKLKNWGNPQIYSPVTKILLAGRFGLGREFKKSILSAGASITIFGILSGMWGKKNNRYKLGVPAEEWDVLPSEYSIYSGEVGVMAEIYGVLDFKITRLRLEARILVGYGIVFETWNGVVAYIRGELRFSVRWVIARFRIFRKTIEISVHLSFSAEFREEYQLQEGNSKFDQYFIRHQSSYTPLYSPVKQALLTPIIFNSTLPPVWPTDQKSLRVLSTLDVTLNDAAQPVIVPLTLIPFASAESRDGQAHVGDFASLVRFIFEWSLSAMFGISGGGVVADESELTVAQLVEADRQVAAFTSSYGQRGEWSAERVWSYLKSHFQIVLSNEASVHGEQGATAFPVPGRVLPVVVRDGVEQPLDPLGDVVVDEAYLRQLNEFFEKLGVPVREEPRNGLRARQSLSVSPTLANQSLTSLLFEEYLDAILRGIWGHLPTRDWGRSQTVKVGDIRKLLFSESDENSNSEMMRISSMVNQQRFGGVRVPEAMETCSVNSASAAFEFAGKKTVSLWDKAQQTIPYQVFQPFDTINTLKLQYESLGITVTFPWKKELKPLDEVYRKARALLQVPDRYIKQDYGLWKKQTVHTIVDDLSVKNGLQGERMLAKPKSLEESGSSLTQMAPNMQLGPSVKLHKQLSSLEVEPKSRESVDFSPALLLKLSVRRVFGKLGAYELLRFKEDDRLLLNQFLKVTAPAADSVETSVLKPQFGDQSIPGEGELVGFSSIDVDRGKSFIGRVNLSTEPNPTDLGETIRSLSEIDNVPIRADFSSADPILRILSQAAVVNSGGYIVRLVGKDDQPVDLPEGSDLMLRFTVAGTSIENHLPPGTNWLRVEEHAGKKVPDSLVLKEELSVKKSAKPPGILSLNIVRRDPSHQFRPVVRTDKHGWRSAGPAELSIEQVLANIAVTEGASSVISGLKSAPEEIRQAAEEDAVEIARRFNLMQLSIEENEYFRALDATQDLPTPPKMKNSIEQLTAGERSDYVYDWSFPMFRLAKKTASSNDLDSEKSNNGEAFVYAGINKPIYIRLAFRDIYGFAPSHSEPENAMVKEEAIERRMLYTDSLVSVLSIPSIEFRHVINEGSLLTELVFRAKVLAKREIDKTEESVEEHKGRLETLYTTLSQAMQQTRDANVTMRLHCSLGFGANNAPTHVLVPGEDGRRYYAAFLRDCRNAVSAALQLLDSTGAVLITSIEDILCELGPFPLFTGPLPDPITPYAVKFELSRPKSLVVEELRESNVDIYSISSSLEFKSAGNNQELHKQIESAVKSVSRNYSVAHGRTPSNDEIFYIINDDVLNLDVDSGANGNTNMQPAYTGLRPLGTRPYSSAAASIGNYSEEMKRKKVAISDFDQDEAYALLCGDLDALAGAEIASQEWSGPGVATEYDEFLLAKDRLATASAKRIDAILNRDKDRVDVMRSVLNKKVRNSLRKRLRGVSELDAILLISYRHSELMQPNQVLLYGRVETTLNAQLGQEELDPTRDPSPLSFSPVVYERLGSGGTVAITFDAKNEARVEIAKFPGAWSITHLRWKPGVDIEDRWMALVSPKQVAMTGNATEPLKIPVVYRKLVKKPSLKHVLLDNQRDALLQPSSWQEQLEVAKNWKLGVDVRREGAAFQDDLILDLNFNVDPYADSRESLSTSSEERPVGDILYEYMKNRGELSTTDQSVRVRIFTSWADELAKALEKEQLFVSTQSLKRRKQKLLLTETKSETALNEVVVRLYKHSEQPQPWDHTLFKYDIEKLGPEQTATLAESNEIASTNDRHEFLIGKTLPLEIGASTGDGVYFAGRRVTVAKLNIFEYESVRPAARVVRNHTLEDFNDRKFCYDDVSTSFRYESEEVLTPDTLTPYLERMNPVDLPSGPLENSLKAFFDLLFKEIDENELLLDASVKKDKNGDKATADQQHGGAVEIQRPELGIRWGYDSTELQDSQTKDSSLRVYGPDPIASLPPLRYSDGRTDEILEISESIASWQKDNGGSPVFGYFTFDIEVFTRLGVTVESVPRPLLRFVRVRVPAKGAL
jgi:hypothetical protein